MNEFSRMKLLITEDEMEKIKNLHVAIFGIGGVGGYAVESLARCGVEELTLIDKDIVDATNINRQIIALHSTIGQPKVEIMKKRILDINPNTKVNTFKTFYNRDTVNNFDLSAFSYIVDAIDTISSKLLLIEQANKSKTKIISAMGAANKTDPTKFEVADIYKTSVCPLAKVMRRELKKRNIKSLKVVYSKEEASKPENSDPTQRKVTNGSFSFVPPVVGFILASEIINETIKSK